MHKANFTKDLAYHYKECVCRR